MIFPIERPRGHHQRAGRGRVGQGGKRKGRTLGRAITRKNSARKREIELYEANFSYERNSDKEEKRKRTKRISSKHRRDERKTYDLKKMRALHQKRNRNISEIAREGAT